MPHAALKLNPGVDQNRTTALNEAAISESQLIRFIPDKRYGGLPQKLGGWNKFYNASVGTPIKYLWGWADVNANTHLGIGGVDYLGVLSSNTLNDITPEYDLNSSVTVSVDTTADSNVVTITDVGSNISDYDSVWIKTHISVGGLILFGLYRCYSASANTYQIKTYDFFGDPLNATSTVVAGGSVAEFETTNGSSIVTVTLADHGYVEGDTFPILVSFTLNGITLFGNYRITDVASTSEFSIQASNAANATSGSPTPINGGNAYYYYYKGDGPLPTGTGFGVGGFGEGGFGSGVAPTASPGTPISAEDWVLDNWGSIFVSTRIDGEIFVWDPTQNSTLASIISDAPPVNHGAFVAMPQRQIISYGSTFDGVQDPLLIRWCDIENYNVWYANPTNQAGSFRLPRGSKIVGALQAPQQCLVWTDVGAWSMQYIGQPYVYSINEIGTGCGLIGQKACGVLGGVTYWMGPSQFYMYGGGGIQPMYCPIWDVIFQDIDTSYSENITFAANSQFNEITWYYPTIGSAGVANKYAKYNAVLQQWDFGTLERTAWINQSVLGPPIGATSGGYIYQHEVSKNADGSPMASSFQTGFFAIAEGNNKVFVDEVWPDMKWGYYDGVQSANVKITFHVTDFPGTATTTYGPYILTQSTTYITPRFRARLMSIEIESDDSDSFWRLGNIRYRFQPDGKY